MILHRGTPMLDPPYIERLFNLSKYRFNTTDPCQIQDTRMTVQSNTRFLCIDSPTRFPYPDSQARVCVKASWNLF